LPHSKSVMAGIVAQYVTAPRFRNVITSNTIVAVAGANPVDLTPQQLRNQRGQLMIQGTSVDNGFVWSFQVQGGVGEFPTAFSRNFAFLAGTNVNCTVTVVATNRIRVETPVGDAGGRIYFFQFFSQQSFGPTVQQTSANTLTDDLIVRVANTVFVQ